MAYSPVGYYRLGQSYPRSAFREIYPRRKRPAIIPLSGTLPNYYIPSTHPRRDTARNSREFLEWQSRRRKPKPFLPINVAPAGSGVFVPPVHFRRDGAFYSREWSVKRSTRRKPKPFLPINVNPVESYFYPASHIRRPSRERWRSWDDWRRRKRRPLPPSHLTVPPVVPPPVTFIASAHWRRPISQRTAMCVPRHRRRQPFIPGTPVHPQIHTRRDMVRLVSEFYQWRRQRRDTQPFIPLAVSVGVHDRQWSKRQPVSIVGSRNWRYKNPPSKKETE